MGRKRRHNTTTLALQQRIFWSLIAVVLCLFAFYGYFVSKSITNVLLREEVEQQMLAVNSNISELEFAYIKKKDAVSLSYAHELGFREIQKKEFVTRKSVLSERLTLNDEI